MYFSSNSTVVQLCIYCTHAYCIFLSYKSCGFCFFLYQGPGEENEDWTAKFFKVISERLGMATGGYEDKMCFKICLFLLWNLVTTCPALVMLIMCPLRRTYCIVHAVFHCDVLLTYCGIFVNCRSNFFCVLGCYRH